MENNVNNVNQEEEDNGKKKWLLLLLLLLLFLLVVIITVVFVRDNGEAVATSKDEYPGKLGDGTTGVYDPEGNNAEDLNQTGEDQLDDYAVGNGLTRVIRLNSATENNKVGATSVDGGNPGVAAAPQTSGSTTTQKVPVKVSGLDKEFFNDSVTVVIEGSDYTATLTDSEGNTKQYTSGTEITEDGEYTLKITESDGTVTEYNFVIDKTAPSITGVENGKTYKSATPVVEEPNLESAVLTKDGEEVEYNVGDTITEEGTYVLTVTDKAGNVTTVTFTIDNTEPTAQMVEIKNIDQRTPGYAKAGDRIWVYVQISEHLSVEPTITINGTKAKIVQSEDGNKFGENWYKYVGEVVMTEDMPEGVITFTVNGYKDAAGNEGPELANKDINYGDVREIILDYTAPIITFDSIVDGVIKKGTNKTITDANPFETVISNEEGKALKTRESYEKYGKQYDRFHISWLGEGTFTVTATDAAGNVTTVTFKVDGTAPTVKNFEIKNIDQKTPGYAKAGDRIWALVSFDEKLGTDPVITINGVQADKVTIHDKDEARNYYQYMAEVVMTKDMPEGVITFKVNGYKDAVGNVGLELTNKDINDGDVREIILDYTAPTITFDSIVDGVIKKGTNKTITDENPFETVISNEEGKTLKTRESYEKYGKQYDRFHISWLGEGTFTVTATDVAGNVATVTFKVDGTAPGMKQLSMANEQKVTAGYAKAGDSIWVYVLFNEKLSVEPVVKINGVVATKKYDYVDETQQQYVGAVTMTKDMPEGEIEVSISGYKDLVGNEGLELTQKDITEGTTIVLDYTAPTITTPRSITEICVYDVNPYTVVRVKDGKTATIMDSFTGTHYNGLGWLPEGTYTIIATDAAGNKTEMELKIDKTAPTVETLGMMNTSQLDTGYAKAGDKVWVYAVISEHLSVEPTIMINGVKADIIQTEDGNKFNQDWYKYVGQVVMTDDMPQGEIKFTVSGYKDLSGNEGILVDNSKINKGPEKIILDTIKPDIKVSDQVSVVIRDANEFTTTWKKLGSNLTGTQGNNGYWGAWQTSFSFSWITDNKFTVNVTATDVAGNVATKEWTIDVTAPVCTSLEIENKNQATGYAKAGDVIKVSVAFNEELDGNPTIKVNNAPATVTLVDGKYVGEVEMQAGMDQGEITVTVDGYKDDSGNVGKPLTNTDITESVKSIILDTIKPVIKFDDNKASGTIADTNIDKYLGRKMKGTINDHIGTFSGLKGPEVRFDYSANGDGEYTIYAYDKAGNEAIEKITVTSALGGDEAIDDEGIVPSVVSKEIISEEVEKIPADTVDNTETVESEIDTSKKADEKELSAEPEQKEEVTKPEENTPATPDVETETTNATTETSEKVEEQQEVQKEEVPVQDEFVVPEVKTEVVETENA